MTQIHSSTEELDACGNHILLIEDQNDQSELVRRAFADKQHKLTLTVASSLKEAAEHMEERPPDLIIADVNLPDGNGLSLLKDSPHPLCPVVIMTSFGDEKMAVEAIKAGALDYVAKSADTLADVPHIASRALREWSHIQKIEKAAQALQESEERFRNLFTNLLAGCRIDEIIYKNGRAVDSRILDVNPACEQIMGIPRDKVVGALGSRLCILHDTPFLNTFERVDKTGEAERFETFFAPTGKHLDCTVSQSEPGICSTVFVDITSRKQAEEAKADQQALIKAIYRNAPLIIMVLDSECRVRQVNNFASQFAGKSVEEMLGFRLGEALGCMNAMNHPKGCGQAGVCKDCTAQDSVLDTLENGTTNLHIEADYNPTPADGRPSKVKLLVSSTPLLVKGESMALLTMLDITEKAALEAQLQQAQKIESVGRLAGGVAHDFNNMLMGIMNQVDICRDELPPNHPTLEYLDEINHDVQRSANLTRQLLAFARKQIITPKIVDLNETVESMLNMLRRLIGEDIDLSWMPHTGLWSIKCDPGQIDQILANLCVNARHAIGGKMGRIQIKTANVTFNEDECRNLAEFKPGTYAMLAVSDNGCGMDQETLEHLFEPFFTTKPFGEGTGLGLSTVYGIVKQNNGFINVHSSPAEGSTFQVYLPSVCAQSKTQPIAAPSTEHEGGTETVMLAEDEKSVRTTTVRSLEKLGYNVLTADSPDTALQLSESHCGPIHLLITDVVMPGMNGPDLAASLAKTRPELKTLYISGYTANVIASRGILDENMNFLSKPFTRETLARKIREVLES